MQDLTQSETSVGPRQPPSARRSALFVFLATTALAVFFAAQNYFAAATMHRAVSWQQATYWSFTD
jgi:hypothetical protein